MMWFAYAMCWLATAGATAVGIYYTKDANCLWAMLVPTFVSFKINRDGREAAQ